MTNSAAEPANNTTHLLVIASDYDWKNYQKPWKPAILITQAGEKRELSCFEKDFITEAQWSCSISWENQLYVFGGASETRQISRLTAPGV